MVWSGLVRSYRRQSVIATSEWFSISPQCSSRALCGLFLRLLSSYKYPLRFHLRFYLFSLFFSVWNSSVSDLTVFPLFSGTGRGNFDGHGRPATVSGALSGGDHFLQPHYSGFYFPGLCFWPTSSYCSDMAPQLHWWILNLLLLWLSLVLLHLLLEAKCLCP